MKNSARSQHNAYAHDDGRGEVAEEVGEEHAKAHSEGAQVRGREPADSSVALNRFRVCPPFEEVEQRAISGLTLCARRFKKKKQFSAFGSRGTYDMRTTLCGAMQKKMRISPRPSET